MSGAIEVSVVIPTRNRWGLLSRRGLRAALLQQDVEHEVIVVDDGSEDETLKRLSELDDPRVRVIENDAPGRVARARNAGVREARGEWIAFLDDDDSWSPAKLRAQLDAARGSDADLAYTAVVTVDDAGVVLHSSPAPPAETLKHDVLARPTIPAGASNVIARTELVRELGGFDARFVNLEDWDLWIRLAWAGQATAVEESLVGCLEHRDSKSLSRPAEAFAELDVLDRKHRDLHRQAGVDLDRVAYSHYVAWLQLRQRRHVTAARIYAGSAIRNRRPRDAVPAARFAARALLPIRRHVRRPSTTSAAPGPDWLDLYR